jgi:hypothetical protein
MTGVSFKPLSDRFGCVFLPKKIQFSVGLSEDDFHFHSPVYSLEASGEASPEEQKRLKGAV